MRRKSNKSDELLEGKDISRALLRCLTCKNICECESEDKEIHTDEDGDCIEYEYCKGE